MTIHIGVVESYTTSELIRDLETGTDIRVTEAGDTRITGLVDLNVSTGALTATGTVLGFLNTLYINVEGAWQDGTAYVKHEGTWKEPSSIYVNQSGTWTRVY